MLELLIGSERSFLLAKVCAAIELGSKKASIKSLNH